MAAVITATIVLPNADAVDWDRRILKDNPAAPEEQRRYAIRALTTLLNRVRGGAEVASVTITTDNAAGAFNFG